jgi:hypothetical protein
MYSCACAADVATAIPTMAAGTNAINFILISRTCLISGRQRRENLAKASWYK